MKFFTSTILTLFIGITSLTAQNENNSLNDSLAGNLYGSWTIDLRPTPNSQAYLQTFTIDQIIENDFEGTFYGSKIKNGLLNDKWGKLYFAFYSSDNSNNYYHSGYYLNGNIYGTTYCPSRDFMTPWVGVKK